MAHQLFLNLDALPLIQTVAFWRTPKPFIHPDRTTPFHVMVYLVQGSMQIIEDGIEYRLTPNSLIFLKSGIHHWGSIHCAPNTTWYYVHFFLPQKHSYPALDFKCDIPKDGILVPEDYEYSILIPKILENITTDQIEKELRHLTDLFHTPISIHLASLGPLFYKILLECVRYSHLPRVIAPDNDRISRLTAYLEEHSREPLDTSLLSSFLGLTYKHAGSLFKTQTGMTILEYHTLLRMNEAARLLRETVLTVTEISEKLGFSDPFYFSNVFKKAHKVAPRDYRKNIMHFK